MKSFSWGKLGQKVDRTSRKFLTEMDDLVRLFSDDSLEVISTDIVAPDVLLVNYRKKEQFQEATPFTNIVIASLVTANARMRLYEALDKLQNQALYCDTG